jgi:hypothetical protein
MRSKSLAAGACALVDGSLSAVASARYDVRMPFDLDLREDLARLALERFAELQEVTSLSGVELLDALRRLLAAPDKR